MFLDEEENLIARKVSCELPGLTSDGSFNKLGMIGFE